jgi:2-dehydro-3-deoxyphosphogluconate aldolase/(4S)-4-hydroxy-2-oxoglutarate aldolase
MTPHEFVEAFRTARASAILRTDRADVARPAMEAAIRGGFRIIEFTLTTPDALELIAEYAARDETIVSAGTVLTVEEARAAVEHGAKCLVSPVLDEAVIAEAHRLEVAVMPGTHTATEMFRAHRAGAQLQKLFPAPGTGPTYVKSMLAPMPFLNIVPTNGVHENNAASYLKAGAVAVGFTTALFDANDMANGAFDRIEERARRLLESIGSDD